MSQLTNHTAFAANLFTLLDPNGTPSTVVVVSAAFLARPGGKLAPLDEQPPVWNSDVYFGAPGQSSIRYEGEIAAHKPRVDVLVNGQAYAPAGRKTERVRVSVRVGDVFKELVVSGDRRGGLLAAGPQPFTEMPIRYERAYGGTSQAKHRMDVRNPVGIGYHGASSCDPTVQSDQPNVEYPNGRSEPAGFGVVARQWQPRLAWAGTYDAAWLADQCPLLPHDFDSRHFQAAPPDQQSATIRGGEQVELRNLTPDGLWQFALPILMVPVTLWTERGKRTGELRLDTVLLEPDDYRVTLLARIAVPVQRHRPPLREVILGQVSRAWERARLTRKTYLDRNGAGGRLVGAQDYR